MAKLALVGGAPASGKTVLAEALAESLKLPLLSKDRIKETLFDALQEDAGIDWPRRLGRASIHLLLQWMDDFARVGTAFLVGNAFRVDDGPRLQSLQRGSARGNSLA